MFNRTKIVLMAPVLKALIDYLSFPVPFIIHPCYWRKLKENHLFRGQGSWKINCFVISWILHTAHQSSKKAFQFCSEVFLVTYFSLSLLTVVSCDQSLSCFWTGWLSFLEKISNLKKEGRKTTLSVTIMHLKIQNRLCHYLLMSVSSAAVHFSNRLIINSVVRFPFLELEVISHFSELEVISSH